MLLVVLERMYDLQQSSWEHPPSCVLCCMQAQQGRPSSALSSWDSRASGSHSMRAGASRRQTRRTAALEPHSQRCCCAAASAVADNLQRRLAELPAAGRKEASAQTIEQALLIGETFHSPPTDHSCCGASV